MVPVNGYVNNTNFSADSIRWLDFVSETTGQQIQHALNAKGEKKIAGISVDGFCEATKTVYQYHVNKYCQYPIGHPDIITEGFGDIEQYFGIVKCRVVAPRELYLPVLPFRTQGKLMFPLCKTCAETLQQSPCTHTEDERALVGTWVTEEVKLAVRKGYRVTHIYEVYDFKKKSDSLFRSYIDLFLKIKQESSGWPAECVTDLDKAEYISQYRQREGISLDAASIEKNPGRRQVAKLALNSFWGR
ncbi:uncharacterized protein LOC129216552 [Uloborus diversus]|uniref:uncharacterized protein LOC129216552 n=1 Tax=Uloborus diversus TaxID=327109 RepID=UPI002409F8D1|nr:uncharacterized protein LOC129216552 [Uloborus diversus]